MKRIRGGSGLGDAIYMRPIVEHFRKLGEDVEVCSCHPDVFAGTGAQVSAFRRDRIDILAHYTSGKAREDTNQWQDICASAGQDGLSLTFAWSVRNQALVDDIKAKAAGQKIVLIHGGRAPMARTDGFGRELLPKRAAFETALRALSHCFTVRVGKGSEEYRLPADLDLASRTSVTDLFDLAWTCDAIVAQCSFMIPLAECFDKPLLAIWAAHGMQYNMHPYIRQITPAKVLSKPTSRFAIDEWSPEQIAEVAHIFIETMRA